MSKRYRRKAQAVQALRTYHGQPMTDIRDFLLGSQVYLSTNQLGSVFDEPITGSLGVTPGDYVLRYPDGQVTSSPAEEFEKLYEVDEWPQMESGLAYALIKNYGFSVDAAFEAVGNKTIRDFLITSMKNEATGHLKAHKVENHITVQGDVADIEGIAKKLEGIVSEECIRKNFLA